MRKGNIFKYAGSKLKVTDILHQHIDTKDKIVIEPFAGTASFSLSSQGTSFYINDTNKAIISLYRQLKHNPDETIKRIYFYQNSKRYLGEDGYYRLRELFNRSTNDRKGLILPTLLKRCYNGLSRFNMKGQFNSPAGRNRSTPTISRESLEYFVKFAKKCQFYDIDYQEFCNNITGGVAPGKGLYFFDPPYSQSKQHQSKTFTGYGKNIFGLDEHIKLAELCHSLSAKGYSVALTNHYSDELLEMYNPIHIETYELLRLISRKDRKPAVEAIYFF